MEFDPEASFADNMAAFQAKAEQLDLECARILFANLDTLVRNTEAARDRQAIQEFHRAVLAALDTLPEENAL